jgi:hypothetical protein
MIRKIQKTSEVTMDPLILQVTKKVRFAKSIYKKVNAKISKW